ncbi:hypothetical protein J6590_069631 [Homalodisca vitripennis]|nr:hypothetical protein J6590_069631 [Homalodisca vitripennis]
MNFDPKTTFPLQNTLHNAACGLNNCPKKDITTKQTPYVVQDSGSVVKVALIGKTSP